MAVLCFFGAQLALAVLGLALAWQPQVRCASIGARLAVAWAGGAVGLTAAAMLGSVLGVSWTALTLAAPTLALSAALAVWWVRREGTAAMPVPAAERLSRAMTTMAVAAAAAGLVHLAVSCATTRCSASDLLYFWGVKAVHFADSGGFAPPALTGPYAIHTHPSYPPLYPVVLSWSTLVAGELPWRQVPLSSVLYLAAAVPVVLHWLRRRLGLGHALAVTAFWTVAVSVALVHSCSGGNAEAALLLFETMALVVLLTEGPGAEGGRFVAVLGLVGAVLTKNEGVIGAGLIVLGVVVRDRLWSGRLRLDRAVALAAAPAAAFALWIVVRLQAGLPLLDPIRERALAVSLDHAGTIVEVGLRHLHGGSRGAVWLAPVLLLLMTARGRAAAWGLLPALTLSVGLFAFLFVYYMHARGNPADLVAWTLPRVTLPALSALILAAGITTGELPGIWGQGSRSPVSGA